MSEPAPETRVDERLRRTIADHDWKGLRDALVELHPSDVADLIIALPVVDDRGILVEDVRLSSLVLADPGTKVGDVGDPPLVCLLATDDREEALKAFEKYDRVALPVTDSDAHMLGVITVDDILDVAEQEA